MTVSDVVIPLATGDNRQKKTVSNLTQQARQRLFVCALKPAEKKAV